MTLTNSAFEPPTHATPPRTGGSIGQQIDALFQRDEQLRAEVAALKESLASFFQHLNAAGVLQISDAVVNATNGIIFPATQNASTNVNTLDDYKESDDTGTLTVTFATPGTSSFAATENHYDYTKEGREVTFRFNVVGVITIGTAVGELRLTGMPYTNANVTSNNAIGTLLWGDNMAKAGYTQACSIVVPAATDIRFAWSGAGGAAVSVVAADIVTGSTLRLRGEIKFHV